MRWTLWSCVGWLIFTLFGFSLGAEAQDKEWKLDGEVSQIIQKVVPSVVTIYLIPAREKSVIPSARTPYGSGIVVDSRGLILTCASLVARRGYKIVVFLSDGRRFFASRVGLSPKYNIALLKIEARGLHPITWGKSQNAKVGMLVLKFGNAFRTAQDYLPAVNLGTLSGIVHKEGLELLRTDAGVNQGDYGGPLVDIQGRLLGILLPLQLDTTTNTYVAYAVPIHRVSHLIPEMKGYLGVLLTLTAKGVQGALVEAVDPKGPAYKAGIRTGDYIVSFGGKKIRHAKDLAQELTKYLAGDRISVVVRRNKKQIRLWVTLSEKIAE